MRIFKIIVITAVLLLAAFVALLEIKNRVAFFGSGIESYDEDQEIPPADLYRKSVKQFEGMLRSKGLSLPEEGTHRLEKEDQLVLVLESSQIRLSEFEGKEVRVKGYVRDSSQAGIKVMDVLTLEIIAEKGARKFDEENFEFRFSYPAEWEMQKEDDKVTFSILQQGELMPVMIVYQYRNVSSPLDIWVKDRDQNLFFEDSRVQVAGQTGVRRIIKNGDQEVVKTYLKSEKTVVELRLVAQDVLAKTQYFSIVEFFQFKTATSSEMVPETPSVSEPVLTTVPSEVAPPAPVTSEEVSKILEKGFSQFLGKSLRFEYPKSWYFSYLGDSVYGMTDDKTYRVSGEVSLENSRILIFSKDRQETCAQEILVDTLKVCAKEEGIQAVIERIAESIEL